VPLVARTTRQDKVRELQRTLYRAAKADPKRRFHALYDKIYRRDVLERAWELVRANRGAAGVDRQTIADVERCGVSRLLDELAVDLRDGRWRPLPARRVFIPKPGRSQERRPLSIPAVRDRVVQVALKTVIEPIFEADMLECSFGFRPRRSAHDALQVTYGQGRPKGPTARTHHRVREPDTHRPTAVAKTAVEILSTHVYVSGVGEGYAPRPGGGR
jgi:RNA-directed DNA polymerase